MQEMDAPEAVAARAHVGLEQEVAINDPGRRAQGQLCRDQLKDAMPDLHRRRHR
jgi:hypothetical protein